MKAFLCLIAAASAVAHNTGVPHAHPHGLGVIAHGPVVAAGYHGRPAGQVSHQSVSKPYQGEHRSTTQSKAFGAAVAAVADSPNRLHGARGVVAHPIAHGFGHGVAHAVAHPVAHGFGHGVGHAVAHPVAHAVAHPVAIAHAPVVHHAPVVAHHAVGGYAQPDYAEPSPYSYTYAVADDYSGAAFNQAESNDGTGVVAGSYSVNLPDGRVQHVNYHANDYDGYVADVTYDGVAAYANTVAHPAVVGHGVALGHGVGLGHGVAVGHGLGLGHGLAVGHGLGLGHGVAVGHGLGHGVTVGHGLGLGHSVAVGHGLGLGHGVAHLG